MTEWRRIKIHEMGRIVTGKTPKTSERDNYGGEIPFLTPSDDMNIKYVEKTSKTLTQKGRGSVKGVIIPADSICVSCIGSDLGKVVITTSETVTNQQINSIIVNTDKYDVDFIYYAMLILGKQLNFHSKTSTAVPIVNKSSFSNYEISCPSLKEQKKIAKILSTIDKKIDLNRKINDNLEQQAIALFKEWFIGRPEAEKWPSVTLGSLTSLICRGITPKYAEDSVQIVINQKCIRDHSIDIELARSHTPKAITEKWLQYGDLLINSTGEGTLGRAAQVWFIPENITVDSHVTIVRPKTQLLIFYIGLWGITHEREIEALHTGSTGQTELPRDQVKAMQLRLPNDDLLAKFNAMIHPMVSAFVANQRENVELAGIRDSLLPKLMSGEIDVSAVRF